MSGSHSEVMGVEEAVLHDKAGASNFLPVGPKLSDANGHVRIPKWREQAAHQQHTNSTKISLFRLALAA